MKIGRKKFTFLQNKKGENIYNQKGINIMISTDFYRELHESDKINIVIGVGKIMMRWYIFPPLRSKILGYFGKHKKQKIS